MTSLRNRAARTDTETRPPSGGSLIARPPTLNAVPRIPGYEIRDSLGQGGMGIVYLAREEALDRLVALKVLPQRLLNDPQALERFRREAKALARIEHPNIVPIYSTGEQDDLPYFTMAYIEGESLADVLSAASGAGDSRFSAFFLRRGSNDHRPDLASGLVAQAVTAALSEMHSQGIVHRDIKPGNILIDAKGRPVVVDFGVACDPRAHRLTAEATSPGTLRFMPPEQLNAGGAADIDVRSDLYSLGVTLFEMLTLLPAFPQEEMGSLIDAIRLGDRPRPRDVDRSIPKALDQIVQRATALRPDDRYQSAEEMEEALKRAVNSLADTSQLSGALHASNIDSALKDGSFGVSRPFSGRVGFHSRPRFWTRSAVVAGTCLLAGAAWLVLSENPGILPAGADGPTEVIRAVDVAETADPDPGSGEVRAGLSDDSLIPQLGSLLDRNGARKKIALEALRRLQKFATEGAPSPLLSATTAFLEGRNGDARSLLIAIEEPAEPVARMVYWQLLMELGSPEERRLAKEILTASERGNQPGPSRLPSPRRRRGLPAKQGGRQLPD
ncbi:MAG: serine/threonine-protein kinase [Planctomycetota bacterium]